MIYGPVNDNGIWKTGHNNQLYSLHDELDPSRQLAVLKPEGTRRVENFKVRWLESTGEDLIEDGCEELET
jgi:hypothetical protein